MSKEKETGKEKGRIRQLARYYIPYKGLFFTDMFFAMLGAAITLVIPLIVRYITSTVVEKPLEQATGEIIRLGILMIAMVLVEMYCNFYIAYYGHVMGARIEHDMRNEIFGHYQKLSFAFFDNQKVGHLLSRITSDLFDISELLHHGPENIVISFIKLIGAMIILFVVNPMLACVPLVVIVVMLLFALVMNSRMKSAFKENRRRIADINSQIPLYGNLQFGNGSLFDADYRYFADCRRIADDRWEAWGGRSGYLSSVHQQLHRSGEKAGELYGAVPEWLFRL